MHEDTGNQISDDDPSYLKLQTSWHRNHYFVLLVFIIFSP